MANKKDIATITNNFFYKCSKKSLISKFSKNFSTNHLNNIASEFDEHVSIKKIKKGIYSLPENHI